MGAPKHSTTRDTGKYQAYVHRIWLECWVAYYSSNSEAVPGSCPSEQGREQIGLEKPKKQVPILIYHDSEVFTTDESKVITGNKNQIMSQRQNGALNAGDNFGIERSFMDLHKGCCEKKTVVSIIAFIPGTHGSSSKLSVPQWPAEPCPLGT